MEIMMRNGFETWVSAMVMILAMTRNMDFNYGGWWV